ncbi:MAG: hypothetical protein LQ339_004667 [Xanthoria mediterranea]|nr:MAG: hypothetical protein LQ339_004667 [Xanthoria mediterranea]
MALQTDTFIGGQYGRNPQLSQQGGGSSFARIAPTFYSFQTQHQTQHDGQLEIHYDATWCRSILGESLLAGLPLNARGYWNKFAREKFAAEDLSLLQKEKKFSTLTLNDIDNALQMAATQPSRAWINKFSSEGEVRATKLKLLACERVGLLHSVDHEDWTQFIFASRFHHRVALQFLHPAPQPMASLPELNDTSPIDGGGQPTR